MILRLLRIFLLSSLLNSLAFAASITGTVTNKTTNHPSVGDDVILLKLSQGMEEAGRTKSDSKGHFVLSTPDDTATYLIRVMHQKVPYHHPLPPGTASADVTVYDAGPEVTGIVGAADVMRMQTENGQLQITEMFALRNTSAPPRSKMSDKGTFELYLPDNSEIDASLAAGPGGMPVNSSPVPETEKNKYAFLFPLRPGETRFQLSYHMPYSSKVTLTPKLTMAMENFVVMTPKSMQVTSATGTLQPSMEDQGMNVYVAKNVPQNAKLTFEVSGTGSIPREQQGEPTGTGTGTAASTDNRPGGGLGVPIDTPDPLHNYRWWILGVVVMLLAFGVIYMLRPPAGAIAPNVPNTLQGKSALLLEVLKDELFQLESERITGKIEPKEYANAKAALDTVITRAMARNTSAASGIPVNVEPA